MTRLARTRPDVVAHRGACGYRPEHTLAAYRLALALGADAVELDLVSTKDGVLVARHEPELSLTTDIASRAELADRRTTKVVDGRAVTGWFVDDLTLAEVKSLRAIERMPDMRPESKRFDGAFGVPTLAEVLTLVDEESARLGRFLQVYAELKHPSWFAGSGLFLETLLAGTLCDARPASPVTVLAFEPSCLRALRGLLAVPLVQLVEAGGMPYDRAVVGDLTSFRDMVTPRGLMRVAEYADAVGVAKNLVLPRDKDGATGRPTWLVSDAHAIGLDVAVWTLRDENEFRAASFRHDSDRHARDGAVAEHRAFLDAGVDVVMGDHPDTAVEARRRWLRDQSSSGIRIHAST